MSHFRAKLQKDVKVRGHANRLGVNLLQRQVSGMFPLLLLSAQERALKMSELGSWLDLSGNEFNIRVWSSYFLIFVNWESKKIPSGVKWSFLDSVTSAVRNFHANLQLTVDESHLEEIN